MSAMRKPDLHLEIAHVLIMDVVGYSKLLVNEQREVVRQLNQIVRKTAQFRKSEAIGKLISIPSGDGMALVFFQSPEEPVQCALEISRVLKNHPRLQLRIGVHSGPVDEVKDVNDRSNVAGTGTENGLDNHQDVVTVSRFWLGLNRCICHRCPCGKMT